MQVSLSIRTHFTTPGYPDIKASAVINKIEDLFKPLLALFQY